MVPIKGVVLAESLYGSLALRNSGDLDLLIRAADAEAALRILTVRGYRFHASPEASNPHGSEWQLERSVDGLPVELRWRITSPQYTACLDLATLGGVLEERQWHGANILALPPEELLVVLCLHGAKHCWSRWMWICDIAQLLTKHPDLDWSCVDTRSRALGARTSIALGVLLACGSLGVEMPEAAARWVVEARRAHHLAERIRRRLLGEHVSGLGGTWYWFLLLDDPADRLRLCTRTARAYSRRLRPNQRDVEFLNLPAPLRFLHYGVRPIRWAIERLKAPRKRA